MSLKPAANAATTHRDDPGQPALWEAADAPSRPVRPRRSDEADLTTLTVETTDFVSRGWGPGTIFYVEAVSHANRGDITVVRQGHRTILGQFAVEHDRPVLLSDRGAFWLGADTEVVGVVRGVEPPLLTFR